MTSSGTTAISQSVIVVGVDGGPEARRALDFALTEAVRRGSTVEVVTAWSSGGFQTRPGVPAAAAFALADASRLQAEEIARAIARTGAAPLVAAEIIEGAPSTVLTRAARTADLLVVGSHGRGDLRGVALGSVAQQCIRMSTCPVVVVPAPDESLSASPGRVFLATV